MHRPVRSMDPSVHASIGGQLTNRKIDKYAVLGYYGKKLQEDYLDAIRAGRYKGLDDQIRKGRVSARAMQALAERPEKPKPAPLPSTLEELLAALEIS